MNTDNDCSKNTSTKRKADTLDYIITQSGGSILEEKSEIYREARYKRMKIDSHKKDDAFCAIIDSDKRIYKVLQQKIVELVLEGSDKTNIPNQLYYVGYDSMDKKSVYEMIEDVEYEFTFEGSTYTSSISIVSKSRGTNMGVVQNSLLFIRGESRESVQNFFDAILITPPVREIYQFSTESKIWRRVGQIAERAENTLILREGVLEDLMNDVDDFVASKDDYAKYGIPYKKVYLFHGEPGTGKTSLSKILAAKTDRSLYILSFDPKMTDDDLSAAIRRIDSESGILLLEDIDCLFKNRSANQCTASVSFSSLLNNLDGAVTNEGLITIITTNHVEVLDVALRRPLRVDLTIKFEKADPAQIGKIFEMYGVSVCKSSLRSITRLSEESNMCPAGISAFLFRYRKEVLTDSNIVDLFKKYIQEIQVEKEGDIGKSDTLYM